MRATHRDQLAITSKLFTSAVFQELARLGHSPLFAVIAKTLDHLSGFGDCLHVRDVFDLAHAHLRRKGHRDEYVYKSALVNKILLGKHSLNTACLLREFRVGECKADIAILNGTSTVYEVKSERDSLMRLDKQLKAYSKVFAQSYVVTSDHHVEAVRDLVDDHVGIMRIGARFHLSIEREAEDRSSLLCAESIFESLRTEEAKNIISALGIEVPEVPNTQMSRVLRNLFLGLDPKTVHDAMVQILKESRSQRPLATLLESLPRSLQTAALCVPLRKTDHTRLITALNTEIDQAMAWG